MSLSSEFDINALLKAFEDAGAEIRPGTGKMFIDGKEIDPVEILKLIYFLDIDEDKKNKPPVTLS